MRRVIKDLELVSPFMRKYFAELAKGLTHAMKEQLIFVHVHNFDYALLNEIIEKEKHSSLASPDIFNTRHTSLCFVSSTAMEYGSSKRVYEGCDASGRRVAVKVLDPTEKGTDFLKKRNETEKDMMEREARMSQERLDSLQRPELTRHVNGILYEPIFDSDIGKYVTVEDLCVGELGKVDEDLRLERPMKYERALDYLTQIYYGTSAMHMLGMMHGDLKFPNILVKKENGKNILRLTDFGFSPIFSELTQIQKHVHIGYPQTTAPELIATETVPTPKADVWSFGPLAYQMLSGKPMFPMPIPISSDEWKRIPFDERIKKFDSVIKVKIIEMGQHGLHNKISQLQSLRKDGRTEIYELIRGSMVLDVDRRYNLEDVGKSLKAQF